MLLRAEKIIFLGYGYPQNPLLLQVPFFFLFTL